MNVIGCIARLVFCLLFVFQGLAKAQESKTDFNCTISRPAVPTQISPDIYGLAAPAAATITNWKIPLIRWGGNTAERYNWQLGNAWNTGADWYFENVAVGRNAWQNFLERGERGGARVFFNLPLIGFVAKDAVSHSYSIKKYGPQQQRDSMRPDAGNGVRPDGKRVVGNDRADSAIVVNPEFIVSWVQEMKLYLPGRFLTSTTTGSYSMSA